MPGKFVLKGSVMDLELTDPGGGIEVTVKFQIPDNTTVPLAQAMLSMQNLKTQLAEWEKVLAARPDLEVTSDWTW